MKAECRRRDGLTERERDTILAALRLFQERDIWLSIELLEIADNGRTGAKARLSSREIDALCERLNE